MPPDPITPDKLRAIEDRAKFYQTRYTTLAEKHLATDLLAVVATLKPLLKNADPLPVH